MMRARSSAIPSHMSLVAMIERHYRQDDTLENYTDYANFLRKEHETNEHKVKQISRHCGAF